MPLKAKDEPSILGGSSVPNATGWRFCFGHCEASSEAKVEQSETKVNKSETKVNKSETKVEKNRKK